MATASLVMGLLAATIGWCICLIFPVLAIIFGHIGMAQTSRGATGRGRAIAGLVLGYLLLLPSMFETMFVALRPDSTAEIVKGFTNFFSSLVA
jgi:hypothetical protein